MVETILAVEQAWLKMAFLTQKRLKVFFEPKMAPNAGKRLKMTKIDLFRPKMT